MATNYTITAQVILSCDKDERFGMSEKDQDTNASNGLDITVRLKINNMFNLWFSVNYKSNNNLMTFQNF